MVFDYMCPLVSCVGVVESRLDLISPTYLSKVFSDQDPTTQGELWDSLLVLTKGKLEAGGIVIRFYTVHSRSVKLPSLSPRRIPAILDHC